MPRSLRSLDPASRQFEHFTNRHKELDALQSVLDLAEGKPLPVLMFWGVGGNGKSWLLRKLREALPPALPSALLDFEPLTGGTPYHTDSSRALAELRRQMASVAFPRFDLAYAWLRHKEGVTDEPLLKGGGPTAKVFDFITEAAPSLAEGVPLVGWLLRQAAAQTKKHLKETRLEAWLAAQVGQEDFQRLRRATTQDLYPELANRFLQDAAANLPPRAGKACRGVLFLDTFEALRLGVPGPAQAHAREEWVRNLYALDSPLLLVLAGRDQLRWVRVWKVIIGYGGCWLIPASSSVVSSTSPFRQRLELPLLTVQGVILAPGRHTIHSFHIQARRTQARRPTGLRGGTANPPGPPPGYYGV